MMTQLSESYRKIRNTFRFALSNLFDFDPAKDVVHDADMWEIDAWMLRRMGALVRQCLRWYDEYEFHRVYHALHDYCSVDLSAFYFDVLKDRLYTFAPNSRGRRSAQTAVYHIARALVRLIAPVLVFTSEEIWKHLPQPASAAPSVHMANFPAAEHFENALDEARAKNWDRLLAVREEVLKALEPARAEKTISANLEAKVTIRVGGNLAGLLKTYREFLPTFFIVSQVEILDLSLSLASSARDGIEMITVAKADGSKCNRCWNYSIHVGETPAYPTLCERCVPAVEEIARDKARQGGAAA